MNGDNIADAVVSAYLATDAFNGLPARKLLSHTSGLEDLKSLIRPLIEAGRLSVVFGDAHPNPHIRAFADPGIDQQVAKLDAAANAEFVLYPTPIILRDRVSDQAYAGRPFTHRLALGAPQLAFATFDLAVIDHYRRDPRYNLWTNDIQAGLSIGDGAFLDPTFPEKHKVLLQTFGFCHTAELKRAVAVFLSDLSELSPEHQQIWAAWEVEGAYELHPDFRRAVMGDWNLKASLREAFIEELRVINAMCLAIERAPLFRETYDEPPRELAFLIRPTVAEFNDFVHTADKLLSENIDYRNFPASIPRETVIQRPDGRSVVQARGSLAMLEDWLRETLPAGARAPAESVMETLRKIRKLRQKPAHAVSADTHDETLFVRQRELFAEAYHALRALRQMLQTDPRTHGVLQDMDDRVRDGPVWEF